MSTKTTATIDFQGKSTTTVPFDTLKKSCEITSIGGKYPKARPVPHYKFLEDVRQIWENTIDKDMDIKDQIFVYDKFTKKVGFKDTEISEVPIENLMFEKVIGKFWIQGKGINNDFLPEVGISIHDKGFSLAYGTRVAICENFSILSGLRSSTQGSDRDTYDGMMERFQKWMNEWEENYKNMMDIIIMYQNTIITESHLAEFFGDTMQNALQHNYSLKDKTIESPGLVMNVTQTHQLIEQSFANKEHSYVDAPNLWTLVNWGTEILSPGTSDPQTVLKTNHDWHNYVNTYFNVDIPTLLN